MAQIIQLKFNKQNKNSNCVLASLLINTRTLHVIDPI